MGLSEYEYEQRVSLPGNPCFFCWENNPRYKRDRVELTEWML